MKEFLNAIYDYPFTTFCVFIMLMIIIETIKDIFKYKNK